MKLLGALVLVLAIGCFAYNLPIPGILGLIGGFGIIGGGLKQR